MTSTPGPTTQPPGARLCFATEPRASRIVCTMGPASSDASTVDRLIEAGMNVARLNFSHGSHESHRAIFETIRDARVRLGKPVAVMQDLQGHKVRVGSADDGETVELVKGTEVLLGEGRRISAQRVGIDYVGVAACVSAGDPVYLDDGSIELTVLRRQGEDLLCGVHVGGSLASRKGVIFPSSDLRFPLINDKDREDALFGATLGVDMIALSFVRSAQEVLAMRDVLSKGGFEDPFLVSKIEDRCGFENIREILHVSDAVLVARGDLGVTVPREQVPRLQKRIIREANQVGIPVITATQMLESMTQNDKPTRAEVNDVYTAILDGSDAVMLSGETASGRYPVEAVQEMDRICREAELVARESDPRHSVPVSGRQGVRDQMAASAVNLAVNTGARCILGFSLAGATLRGLAGARGHVPLYGVVKERSVLRSLLLHRGLSMITMPRKDQLDELVPPAIEGLREAGVLQAGDRVVVVAKRTSGPKGAATHLLELIELGDE